MGPKKGKDVIDENSWRTYIETTPLNEENWTVKVIVFEAAGSDQDRIYLNKFEIFAAEEKRFVVKNICKTETIFMVNQLGGEKKVKDDNLRVFEEGQAYLKDKKDIPPNILALIIKHLILKMKEEYLFIKRQRLEVREGMRRESATMVNPAEVRGTIVKSPEPTEVLPTPKGKGKKDEPDPSTLLPEPDEGKKYNTLLRVRGEEWRDKVYVDDYPDDGANLYVALTGFVEAFLPVCLVKVGIPLTAVVQIRIDPVMTKVPSTLLRATKRGQSQTEMLTDKSLKFWEDLQSFRIRKETVDDFKNTAFIVFSPPYCDTDSLSGNPDKIYDELCYLMYDIQDLTRQHNHFLENMDIIHIAEKESEKESLCNKVYHQLTDDLPLECVTMYYILDNILQTACLSLEGESSKSSLSTDVTMNAPRKSQSENKVAQAENLVKDIFSTLCKTDGLKKSYRITYGEEYETHKDPIVINYGDFAKHNTFHLGNINLDKIVWSTLFGMPINNLWKNQSRPTGELEAKVNFHVNVLLSCFDRQDVETAELNRLIHILACRKLYNNRSSLKKRHLAPSTISDFKKAYLKRSVLAEPLTKCPGSFHESGVLSPCFPSMTKSENASDTSYSTDPEVQRIRYLFDCPDISELISAAEIANGKPINHMIDDFDVFEDFTGISAFEIMLDAFTKFNCVDYKYCEVTDCIVLMFFNSHDKDGIAREEWRCQLPTALCLQDFFDFVLDEHYDWIQKEENIYDERRTLNSQSENKICVNPFLLKSCVDDNAVDVDLLMEGSLKYKDLAQFEDTSPDTTEMIVSSSKKTTMSPSSVEVESKSPKKAKPATTSSKRIRTALVTDRSYDVVNKPFSGYDLGDRRVEVFGKDAMYFSKDGTKVTSMYTVIIPMNLEYIVLNVLPGQGNNEFWFHKALGDDINPDISDACESFRITSKDQVMINIIKQAYKIPLPLVTISASKDVALKASTSSKINDMVFYETKSFHSLFVTWPNGLITESVHESNTSIISHIKQYHVSPLSHLDEDMRCISLNGEVIVFKTSGEVEVLKPDGSYIKIKHCEKKLINDAADDLPSEASSDKSKKSKGKDKTKEKLSKSSSKSSKYAVTDDDKAKDEKPPEYELLIKEFESIDTSGLRQKWIDNIPCYIEKLLIRTATDYCLGEIFSRRMDGTSILLNKDGIQIVTFPDKTRIITYHVIEDEIIYPEWTDEEKEYFDMLDADTNDTDIDKSKGSISQKSYTDYSSSVMSSFSKKNDEEEIIEQERTDGYVSVQMVYTIEHANFTSVTINKVNGKIYVDSPNETTVVIDSNNSYDIKLDNVTSAKFNGESLHIDYEACPECRAFTTCNIKVTPDDMSSVSNIHQSWLKMKDSFGKKIIVNEEGSINLVNEFSSSELIHNEDNVNPEEITEFSEKADEKTNGKSESSVVTHGKCREMYLAKTIRFFVMRRELTCAELVHRSLLEQYKRACRWQPWCSINQYDTFADHRSLLSVLTPVHLTETEKWLMDSKLAGKPKYLTYKDLKKDCGKGFYHWMRPYERFEAKPMKPENVLPPRQPRAFILRTLEQQWKENEREQLKGAKELLMAIIRYRHVMEADSETILNLPILDPRPEDERQIDDIIQALAHRIYGNLKMRLDDDIQTRAKTTITTKPPLPPEDISVEGEQEAGIDLLRNLKEERLGSLKKLEAAEEMSPVLAKYWRRRNEELKEEQFYKYLLREGSVPPYFRNVLGGAIWWEMNSATDDAVTKAERRKMKCVCADGEGTSRTEDTVEPYM